MNKFKILLFLPLLYSATLSSVHAKLQDKTKENCICFDSSGSLITPSYSVNPKRKTDTIQPWNKVGTKWIRDYKQKDELTPGDVDENSKDSQQRDGNTKYNIKKFTYPSYWEFVLNKIPTNYKALASGLKNLGWNNNQNEVSNSIEKTKTDTLSPSHDKVNQKTSKSSVRNNWDLNNIQDQRSNLIGDTKKYTVSQKTSKPSVRKDWGKNNMQDQETNLFGHNNLNKDATASSWSNKDDQRTSNPIVSNEGSNLIGDTNNQWASDAIVVDPFWQNWHLSDGQNGESNLIGDNVKVFQPGWSNKDKNNNNWQSNEDLIQSWDIYLNQETEREPVSELKNLSLRPIFIGNEMELENFVKNNNKGVWPFQKTMPYAQAFLIANSKPYQVLGAVPLRKSYLPNSVDGSFVDTFKNDASSRSGDQEKYGSSNDKGLSMLDFSNNKRPSVTQNILNGVNSLNSKSENYPSSEKSLNEKDLFPTGGKKINTPPSKDLGDDLNVLDASIDAVSSSYYISPQIKAENQLGPNVEEYDDYFSDFKIIGGNAATGSGTPLSTKGRSGFIA